MSIEAELIYRFS